MNANPIAAMTERYQGQYREHGYSPKSLGWDKGKQEVRFQTLFEFFSWEGRAVLDIGCGFGDFAGYLTRRIGAAFNYTGIDLVPEFISEARVRNAYPTTTYLTGDFLQVSFDRPFDIVVGSGIFNHKFDSRRNEAVLEETMRKAFAMCREGIAFDCLTDKVDFKHTHTHHTNPEWLLGLGYSLTRNLTFRNDVMPFECAIALHKDQDFQTADTLFTKWKVKQDLISGA
jgi:2-polyprenyl-3-methyl-5-hydroxy-6-metoxy-1,4-benzoquinol methylase